MGRWMYGKAGGGEAEQFFLRAMAMSEGSEQARYTKIYTELKMGKEFCTDGEEW